MQPGTLSTLLALVALTAPTVVAESNGAPPWSTLSGAVHAMVQPHGYELTDDAPPEGIWIAISTSSPQSYSFSTLHASLPAAGCEVTTNDDAEWTTTIFVFIASECIQSHIGAVDPVSTQFKTFWGPSTGGVAYYDGDCTLLKPGVNPDRFPYVFVIIREECLEPYFSGMSEMEISWRWR